MSKAEIREKVREKLKLVNLDGYQDYMPSDLSGGMVKRAALRVRSHWTRIFSFSTSPPQEL